MNSNGALLLSSSKDNSIRLWDIRMVRPIRRFKGHQNTSKNFIRAGFANSNTIVSGSEDGLVYCWDSEKGDLIGRLQGHDGVVYSVATSSTRGKWITASDDRTIRSWVFNDKDDNNNNKEKR
jgi:WD40 repeat protein